MCIRHTMVFTLRTSLCLFITGAISKEKVGLDGMHRWRLEMMKGSDLILKRFFFKSILISKATNLYTQNVGLFCNDNRKENEENRVTKLMDCFSTHTKKSFVNLTTFLQKKKKNISPVSNTNYWNKRGLYCSELLAECVCLRLFIQRKRIQKGSLQALDYLLGIRRWKKNCSLEYILQQLMHKDLPMAILKCKTYFFCHQAQLHLTSSQMFFIVHWKPKEHLHGSYYCC